MASSQQTSLISILSCVHGRLRREERDIDKRDVQAALKYGTRTPACEGRWKFEYDNIIFIVDPTMKFEITAYPKPLCMAPLNEIDKSNHKKARKVIQHKPELCKSHTVLVVDNSGSMQTHDIPLHLNRQVAVYSTMALEYVAEQLFQETVNDSDVVSLIEFNEDARVVFTREPCSWVMYNRLLERRETGTERVRQVIRQREVDRADSNYLPALQLADALLDTDRHDECALALFFLSDGEPSDARNQGWTTLHAKSQICASVTALATKYSEYISISFVGFGNSAGDFSTLEAMADACNTAPGGAKAEFTYCEKVARTIGTSVTSLVTSLTQTRTSLMGRGTSIGPKRSVVSEKDTGMNDAWQFFKILNHWIYSPQYRCLVNLPTEPPGALWNDSLISQRTPANPPPFLAVNTRSCGYGAERIAFRCFLSKEMSATGLTLGAMVAKETNLVNKMSENVEFHKAFCETQSLASFLAHEFNTRIRATSCYNPATTPIIIFLPCSILLLDDHTVEGGKRGVLVEKMLDTKHFKWCKWNDNGGGVEGKPYHAPLDLEYEHAAISHQPTLPSNGVGRLDDVIEEGSEEDEDSDKEIDYAQSKETDEDGHDTKFGSKEVSPEAYLQAFSHFTHKFTNRKALVCDLQGVYNTDTVPPTFELTDPAIHYRSNRGRRMVYGRTDKGVRGMELFFKTHKCTDVCRLINLSKATRYWHQAWCKHHHKQNPS